MLRRIDNTASTAIIGMVVLCREHFVHCIARRFVPPSAYLALITGVGARPIILREVVCAQHCAFVSRSHSRPAVNSLQAEDLPWDLGYFLHYGCRGRVTITGGAEPLARIHSPRLLLAGIFGNFWLHFNSRLFEGAPFTHYIDLAPMMAVLLIFNRGNPLRLPNHDAKLSYS
ncbi:hypothetical protein ABKN59_008413 [Abortiporus biennis]